jgi:hypothetical protein
MAFCDVWLRRWLVGGGAFAPADIARAEEDFRRAIVEHRRGIDDPESPWAVKVPRCILMLSYWRAVFPDLRFLHVVRSGLDMAYSADNNQLNAFQDLVLTEEELALPRPLRAMAYWRTVNLGAGALGEASLGDRYRVLRFEDLCRDPRGEAARLGGFLEGAPEPAAAEREVIPPKSLGRWTRQPAKEVLALLAVGRPALEHFGYWSAPLFEQVEEAARRPAWRRLLEGRRSLVRSTAH